MACAKKSNIRRYTVFKIKFFQKIVNAPWYIGNNDILRDIEVKTVVTEITKFAVDHENRLYQRGNLEATQLLCKQCSGEASSESEAL